MTAGRREVVGGWRLREKEELPKDKDQEVTLPGKKRKYRGQKDANLGVEDGSCERWKAAGQKEVSFIS